MNPNNLDDTLSSLYSQSRFLAKFLMAGCEKMFDEYGKVEPCGFYLPLGKEEDVQTMPVERMDDETKPQIWAAMRALRAQHPITAFVSEVWSLEGKAVKGKTMQNMPRPSESPDRQENIMVHLWQYSRMVTIMAKIHRHPDRLGDWTVFYDSLFAAKTGAEVEGAMMQGGTCQLEGN